jgi:hypothetical protein
VKFRKKPVVIEALLYTGENLGEIQDFIGEDNFQFRGPLLKDPCIRTLEGPLLMSMGDWIIKGVKGEFYPCKPDIFAATYEPVEERKSLEERK